MKKKVLLSSILTIALCLSLIAGSTFALFTSKQEFNIAVTSGTVDLTAGVAITKVSSVEPDDAGTIVDENGATYAYSYEDAAEPYNFINGGTAVVAGAEVTLDNITPGDKIDLLVSGTNNSDVTIQYRYVIECTEGLALMHGLKVYVNGATEGIKGMQSYTSVWTKYEAPQTDADKAFSLPITIELPVDAGNVYQNKTAKIKVTVEAVQGNASITNITEPEIVKIDMVTDDNELAAALTANEEEITVTLANDIDLPITSLGSITAGSGEYKLGGADTESIIIDLNGNKLNITTGYWSAIGANNADATITIKNGSLTSTGNSAGTWNAYDVRLSNCNYVIEDVTFEKAVAFDNAGKSATLNNVTINENGGDKYALWITAEGQNITIDGLTINSTGRGIKIDEQYVSAPSKVTLNVTDATFNTVKKAAILVKSVAGADINLINVDIANVAADTVNAVWNDSDAAAYFDLVTVTGGTLVQE